MAKQGYGKKYGFEHIPASKHVCVYCGREVLGKHNEFLGCYHTQCVNKAVTGRGY